MNSRNRYAVKWQDDWPWREPTPEYDSEGFRVDNTRDRAVQEWSQEYAIALLWLMILALAGAMWWLAYAPLDSVGWVGHTVQAEISAPSNWLVGETKGCASTGANAFAFVGCGGSSEKLMTVTFYGRAEQAEYATVYWQCTRNDSSFTCRETGGSKD